MKNKVEPTGWASMAAAVIVMDLFLAIFIWLGFNLMVGHPMISYWQAIGATILLDLVGAFRYAFSELKG
jgi:hypothetical protein